ncbi:hypothetical protein AVEN_246456-1 [Araneus ventricosus]|uniref:Uncharacterized protein n=1 Tax=Araneus ventricosus TaxID=182803 RepID=A0A4Y2EPQ1_ARAVE|nr:hypothetical protein AVEN_246456-1 [Araneus ventricosus]
MSDSEENTAQSSLDIDGKTAASVTQSDSEEHTAQSSFNIDGNTAASVTQSDLEEHTAQSSLDIGGKTTVSHAQSDSGKVNHLVSIKEIKPFLNIITREQNINNGMKTAEFLPTAKDNIIKAKRELDGISNKLRHSRVQDGNEYFKGKLYNKRKVFSNVSPVTETNNQNHAFNKIKNTTFQPPTMPEMVSLITELEDISDKSRIYLLPTNLENISEDKINRNVSFQKIIAGKPNRSEKDLINSVKTGITKHTTQLSITSLDGYFKKINFIPKIIIKMVLKATNNE